MHFYPRPPRGGRPVHFLSCLHYNIISIHALREEGDQTAKAMRQEIKAFLSTPSARRATNPRRPNPVRQEFLSTPSARRATEYQGAAFPPHIISIHALREEGDPTASSGAKATSLFLSTPSARRATKSGLMNRQSTKFLSTPSARRATREVRRSESRNKFLSTPSARRATGQFSTMAYRLANFYPRPPRGGRPSEGINFFETLRISIHALREEGDCKNGEKHLRFCFIIKRSAQIWKSLSKNIRKNSCDLHRTA